VRLPVRDLAVPAAVAAVARVARVVVVAVVQAEDKAVVVLLQLLLVR
jgi:hypothetical protein